MPDDAAALDDLLASPAPMGDDEEAPDTDADEDTGDEFSEHAAVALDPDADPEERTDALRMAIQSLIRGG